METMSEWIDRAKAATKTKSDSNMARKFGVVRSALCAWRHGEKVPAPDTMRRMAERAGFDVDEALIIRAYWASQNETREAFARIYQKLAGCVVASFACFYAIKDEFLKSNENSELLQCAEAATREIICIMLY